MRSVPLLLLVAACGGPAPVQDEPAPDPVPVAGEGGENEDTTVTAVQDQPRALGPTATFVDLVSAARRLDDRGQGSSDVGCVLRGTGETGAAWRLEGDIATGVRPLPDPPATLLARLARPGPVRILSRWGQRGEGDLTFAAFTSLPPPRDGGELVVIITEDGMFLRATVPGVVVGPVPIRALAAAVDAASQTAAARVFVTAEAGTSLVRLKQVIEALPSSARTKLALAVALGENVTLPDAPAQNDTTGVCADGLPPVQASSGELETPRILAALVPLREAAAECMTRASVEASRGGRLVVAMRVVSGGRVDAVCATEDGLGDPALRACVLRAAQALTFPDPGGTLDMVLPLRLEPDRSERQEMLCR